MKILKYCLVFFILIPFTCWCQDTTKHSISSDTTKNPLFDAEWFAPSAGLSYQGQLFGEVGVMYVFESGGGPCNPPVFVGGPKIASEFNFKFNHFIIGPKVSIEVNFICIGARFSIIDYTDFKNSDWRATPEVGLSLFGGFNVFYGYNFHLSSSSVHLAGTNRITFMINI